jgi:hypothetical protein
MTADGFNLNESCSNLAPMGDEPVHEWIETGETF